VNELQGLIFDIRKFSLHDGPGIRTTVFFKGCPLSCWWCHNPESQSAGREVMLWEARCVRCGECAKACPIEAIDAEEGRFVTDREVCIVCQQCMDACASEARALVGEKFTVDQVMEQIERDVAFFEESGGGVTFSGGEPMVQRSFLRELLMACKAKEIHTAVDTSGYTPWEALHSIMPYTDLFLYDIKLFEDSRHRHYTGVPNGLILHNLQALANHGARIWVRVPVIPGINDDAENLEAIAQFVSGLPAVERIDLLPYHGSAAGKYARLGKEYLMPETSTPTADRMTEISGLMEKYRLQVTIGG
jgi:pyruvate formate lyase activating enzyme